MTTRANGVRQRALRGLVAVVGVAAIAVGGLSVANAATLTVNGGGVSTLEAAPCTTQIAVSRANNVLVLWYSQVRLTMPSECAGLPVYLVVDTGAGSPPRIELPSGLSAGTHTLTLSSNPFIWQTDFRLIVDGWEVDT